MLDVLRYKNYKDNKTEINRNNLTSLRVFALINIPISIMDIIYQKPFGIDLTTSIVMSVYAVALWLLVHFLVKDNDHHATLLMYLAEFPPIICAIINGTFADPTHLANSYMIFIILMPVMILDYPVRLIAYQAACSLVLIVLSYISKPEPELFIKDTINVIRSLILGFALDLVVVRARIQEIDRARRAMIEARKDPLTGLGNRTQYRQKMNKSMNMPVALVCFHVDSYKVCNDMFGHEFGDRLLEMFSRILTEHFRAEDCYHFSGANFFVVLKGSHDIHIHLQHGIEQCFQDFSEVSLGKVRLHPSLSVGYVTDIPKTEDHLKDMLRLADVRSQKAEYFAAGKVIGGEFDPSLLKAESIGEIILNTSHEAAKDELTGFMQITPFVSMCENLIGQHLITDEDPCFLYINVLGMKSYNEKYGFSAGDQLIQDIANLIRKYLPGRAATRTAGDHFLVFSNQRDAENTVSYMERDLKDQYKNRSIRLNAGQYNMKPGDRVALACDRAKIAADSIRGKDTLLKIYDSNLETAIQTEQFLTGNLLRAINEHHIVAYFQPVFDAATETIYSCEALARWIDPERGMISPGVFVPVLEDAHLINYLDMAIISDTIHFLRERIDAGEIVVPVSVNLSRYDLADAGIVDEITDMVDIAQLDHELLKIEITESAVASDEDRINQIVHAFQSRGFEVWMDDFGSGYSSLNMLQETSFDLIKLDMRFMRTNNPERGMILVRGIIPMAHSLGLKTLVEGVETREQVEALKEIGCGKIQGFYFSKPLSKEKLTDFITKEKK